MFSLLNKWITMEISIYDRFWRSKRYIIHRCLLGTLRTVPYPKCCMQKCILNQNLSFVLLNYLNFLGENVNSGLILWGCLAFFSLTDFTNLVSRGQVVFPLPSPRLWRWTWRVRMAKPSKKRKRNVSSVADPDPGSGIGAFFTPGSGIGLFRIPDLGSRIPNSYFWDGNFLGKKFHNSLKFGPNFFLEQFKN